eukprot:TRINITY_DN19423_c0_g1_i3.p1 TRINITY_DN19423_c0_g1~~TRINITY_DN19423_c0_g1_i3.p1  ORF type:complete len:490 (+),score=110.26 TRINITY_DN19423_c0_g1_i3:182-1651(+)
MGSRDLDLAGASALVRDLRAKFTEGITRPLKWRKQQILGVKQFLDDHARDIEDAVEKDLGRSAFLTQLAETVVLQGCIKRALANLKKWMTPEKVNGGLLVHPSKCEIVSEPLGVVLIIGPWNFPILLHLEPLVGALAAGNAVVIKVSELCPEVSSLIAISLPKYVDQSAVRVVEGGPAVGESLLKQRWDKIFFTGSLSVGKLVLSAAAQHVTPVTLELGGKSPTIVDATADLRAAARRIANMKFCVNAGQICLAPDYVLVEEVVASQLVNELVKAIKEFMGDDVWKAEGMSKIINVRHMDRLANMLKDATATNFPGTIVYGGVLDKERRYFSPTIVRNAPWDSSMMTEEIFGPILPIQEVKTIAGAIEIINSKPKALALYYFTRDESAAQQMVDRTSSGGVVINNCVVQNAVHEFPFGGVGESGMGAYHGKLTFDTFSHKKPLLRYREPIFGDPSFMYPPFTPKKKSIMLALMQGSLLLALLSMVGLRQ